MNEILALLKKDWLQFCNRLSHYRKQPLLKKIFILAFVILLEGGLTRLFMSAFKFLSVLGGVGLLIIGRLYVLFFLGLGAMLAVSSIITSYASVYQSSDMPFLLTKPLRTRYLSFYKFLESISMSSWSFFFAVIPFVAAYIWHEKLSPLFIVWIFLFSIPFILISCSIGTLISTLAARLIPSYKKMAVWSIVVVGIALAIKWKTGYRIYYQGEDPQISLSRLLPGMSLASNPLLPNFWVAEGALAFLRQDYLRGSMFFFVLTTTSVVFAMLIDYLGNRTFYNTWESITSGLVAYRRAPVLLPRLERALLFIGQDVRGLVMKDIRTFFRDPSQWSQSLIFFGLLGLYFSNLRSFNYHNYPAVWRNTIAFLNVFSVGSVMCSLGSRFVYPQFSLEGQSFWIIGLTPTTPRRILLTKFLMAFIGLGSVSVFLMLLSSRMLDASMTSTLISTFLAASISAAVSGLSTGLGAIFIDLRQRNPSAIVSGFGGTLNLVLSLFFMLASIIPFGLAFHLQFLSRISARSFFTVIVGSTFTTFLLTLAFTIVPLVIAARIMKNRDFNE